MADDEYFDFRLDPEPEPVAKASEPRVAPLMNDPATAALREQLLEALRKKDSRYPKDAYEAAKKAAHKEMSQLTHNMATAALGEWRKEQNVVELNRYMANSAHHLKEAIAAPLDAAGVTLLPERTAIFHDLLKEAREDAKNVVTQMIDLAEMHIEQARDRSPAHYSTAKIDYDAIEAILDRRTGELTR